MYEPLKLITLWQSKHFAVFKRRTVCRWRLRINCPISIMCWTAYGSMGLHCIWNCVNAMNTQQLYFLMNNVMSFFGFWICIRNLPPIVNEYYTRVATTWSNVIVCSIWRLKTEIVWSNAKLLRKYEHINA